MKNRFNGSFFLSAAISAVILLAGLHVWWKSLEGGLAVRPAFPVTRDYYPSSYGGLGSVTHYMYQHGLFGAGRCMRESDVLLLGSSHTEYGISAGVLSEKLSRLTGHPVGVYNLGLGFGEGLGIDQYILETNRVKNKAVIVDLFTSHVDNISCFARRVMNENALNAWLQSISIWLSSMADWVLDPLLPRLALANDVPSALSYTHPVCTTGPVAVFRFLGLLSTRSWANGDAVELWDSSRGSIFRQACGAKPIDPVDSPYLGTPNVGIALSNRLPELRRDFGLSVVFTLVPFSGCQTGTIPGDAKPIVPISPAGLLFYDKIHLTDASRKLATDQLWEGMEKQGIISDWLRGAKADQH